MYSATDDGMFIVENYNWEASFSNFLPGIAGTFGIPMWIYYISRNQCIISAGIRDKNHPIMEFRSYNKALSAVGTQGFRTFMKIDGGRVREPFRKTEAEEKKQSMKVSSSELEIQEHDAGSGITTRVLYFMLVNAPFAGMVRKVTFINSGEKRKKLEFIDGLPRILPYGVDLHGVNTIARHIEGMMEAALVDGAPLFRLKQTPADIEKVSKIEGGNFYLTPAAREYIVDPVVLFGEAEIYDFPWNFKNKSISRLLQETQIRQNRTPCAFSTGETELAPGEEYSFYSVIGYAEDDAVFRKIRDAISETNYFDKKRKENSALIENIKKYCSTSSADYRLDRFCEQNFLDNVIRGGMPEIFEAASGSSAIYLYSRQNGDLERDYHFFVLEPTYYSQGTGHYRSVNQNRRCDAWFFPEIEDKNIHTFMNLIQLDSYNPLEITRTTYSLKNKEELDKWTARNSFNKKDKKKFKSFLLNESFTPGQIALMLEKMGAGSFKTIEKTARELISLSEENECGAEHEGFWIDHWFYNLDLIENYLMIYPDRLQELLIANNHYYFYDNPDVVLPRSEKYALHENYVYQYDAVRRNPLKTRMITSRPQNPNRVRTDYGEGEVYYTNLLVKLLCVITNRMATLDPAGTGIEMEAGKPGWNDSMNGLPGILGSSLCETLEMQRAIRFLAQACEKLASSKIKIFNELYEFMTELEKCIDVRINSDRNDKKFKYWDDSHTIKEKYREKTKYGIAGQEQEVSALKIKTFLDACLALITEMYEPENKNKIFNQKGIPYTYFINKVVKFDYLYDENGQKKRHESGAPLVRPLEFEQSQLPLFLEGPVHMLKVHPDLNGMIYEGIRKSDIFDEKLKMYKVCESLETAPFEIGRVKAWGPGWIENESVYTHMEYKYLLELLKSGLYDEFYRDIKTALTPFMTPRIYRRSIFENVSFIVSGAFPDEKLHGQGFQPRLSGVTGEMVNIWILMTAGRQPFFVKNGQLGFTLNPILPSWLFTTENREINQDGQRIELPSNSFAFRLFGKTDVIYINPLRKNTYEKNKAEIVEYELEYHDGEKRKVNEKVIASPVSLHIREGKLKRIKAILR